MASKRTYCFLRKRNFTLVELIVVMIIMTMMLVVALPAFTHLGKGYKLTEAAQEVNGQISIAKSYAIANHCYMAVVFPQKSELDSLAGSETAKKDSPLTGFYNASCRIALVTKRSSGTYEFVMWKPDSNWVILPENTIIGVDSGDFGTMNEPLQNVRLGDLIKLYKASPSDSEIQQVINIERYIVVTPDGQLAMDGNTTSPKISDSDDVAADTNKVIRIRMTEGAYNRSKGDILYFERTKGQQVFQYVEFDPLTARANYREYINE